MINKIKEARSPHVRFISLSGKSVWGRGGSVGVVVVRCVGGAFW
jgi:hypothetical protein